MKKTVILFLAVVCITVIVFATLLTRVSYVEEPTVNYEADYSYREDDLHVQIIEAANNTYGYDIVVNGRILIHQPHIPAANGNQGFATQEDAQRVAEFVILKILQNISPPSVSVEEVDSLIILSKTIKEN